MGNNKHPLALENSDANVIMPEGKRPFDGQFKTLKIIIDFLMVLGIPQLLEERLMGCICILNRGLGSVYH